MDEPDHGCPCDADMRHCTCCGLKWCFACYAGAKHRERCPILRETIALAVWNAPDTREFRRGR